MRSDNQPDRPLWVLWRRPRRPIPSNAIILSFLAPDEEAQLVEVGVTLLSARREVDAVRSTARAEYLAIVADLGLVRNEQGQTFRELMVSELGTSVWWYHPVSFKDCEHHHMIYDSFLATHAINAVFNRAGASSIHFVGATQGVVEAFAGKASVSQECCSSHKPFLNLVVRGVLSRFKFAAQSLWETVILKLVLRPSTVPLHAAFFGFLGRTHKVDFTSSVVIDPYYGRLPTLLKPAAQGEIGWFMWADKPHLGWNKGWYSDVVLAAKAVSNVVVLQGLLSVWSILQEAFCFRHLLVFSRFWRAGKFDVTFNKNDLDFSSLFREELLEGFANSTISRLCLMEQAVSVATRQFSPEMVFCFCEHFPPARALYGGIRSGASSTKSVAIQHASYNSDKVFLFLDPDREFRGEPDDRPCPTADTVFAMGQFAAGLFAATGYPTSKVRITGSPRYQHVAGIQRRAIQKSATDRPVRVLLVTGLSERVDLDLVLAGAETCQQLAGVVLRVRLHPHSLITRNSSFTKVRERLEVSHGTLEADLTWADLVVFSYSTVAEEAYVLGVPVVQWAPLGFNGSALSEVTSIPRCYTVNELREFILGFQKDPSQSIPNESERLRVMHQLFGPAGGLEAERIRDNLAELGQQSNTSQSQTAA